MNIREKIGAVIGASAALVPFAALAQGMGATPNLTYFQELILQMQGLVSILGPLLVGVAVVLFFWGVIRYVTAGEDPEKRKAGRDLMIWGVVAIFVIVSFWGLVIILQELTGISGETTVPVPEIIPGY